MTSTGPVQCLACKHLDRSDAAAPSRCAAYPVIPVDIVRDGADHRTARGDERDGLTFAQADTAEARDAFTWWSRTFHRG